MGSWKFTYRALVGRPDGKRQYGNPRRKWEEIKMDLQVG